MYIYPIKKNHPEEEMSMAQHSNTLTMPNHNNVCHLPNKNKSKLAALESSLPKKGIRATSYNNQFIVQFQATKPFLALYNSSQNLFKEEQTDLSDIDNKALLTTQAV
jgi:hypothetical protein